MKSQASHMVSLDEARLWQADKRFLPAHLRTSDNTRRIEYYKKGLRSAVNTQLTATQREQLLLFYQKRHTKTQIGEMYGVGSSAICKAIKSSEKIIREYVELFMKIYDLIEREGLREDDEYGELRGG